MLSQHFFDALASIVFPGLASLHLLVSMVFIIRIRSDSVRSYWIVLLPYFISMCVAFSALSLGFGSPIVLDVETARNYARIFFGFSLAFGITFVILYLINHVRNGWK